MVDNIRVIVSKKYSKKLEKSHISKEVQNFVAELDGCIPGWNRDKSVEEIKNGKIQYGCAAEDDNEHRADLLYLQRDLEKNHIIHIVGDVSNSQTVEFVIEE